MNIIVDVISRKITMTEFKRINSSNNSIYLVSSDGLKYELDKLAIKHSQVICSMVEESFDDDTGDIIWHC